MAKARLYFDGDNTYIEKQARIYKMVDEIGDKIDNIPGVVNNLSSTSETDALSAAMGKELQDQINAMSGNFHFLSSWDCTTGLPGSDPATDPYVYQSGDYYIVSTVAGSGGTNYKPHGSSYTHGVASTAVETQSVQMNDWYVYDGSTWILQPSGGAQIVIDTALSTTSTNPVENRVITQALNNKQDTIANLSAIESGAAAGATALQPGANITQLTNNAGYQTAGDVASAIAGKQDTLTAGEGIAINNNVITNTGITCLTGGTDINVVSGVSGHNLPTGYTEIEYIYSEGGSGDKPYIDTGITIGSGQTYSNTDITLDYIANLLSNGGYCVSGTAFAYGIGLGIYGADNNPSYGIGTSSQTGTGTVSGQKLRWYINGTNGQVKIEDMNGMSQFSTTTTTNTITTNNKILVGSYSGDTNPPSAGSTSYNKMKGYMYEFKVYGGSTLIRHGIPAIQDSNNEVGLYDIVGNQFYGSANSGTWTAGPETVDCTTVNFTNASGYMLKSSNKLIYATTDTAFNTRDKVCTTADGNYTPREGDVLALVFNNGCGVGSPRLDIDNSGLHSISISTTGANASTLWLGMDKITWLFVYDGSRWITWPIKDTTYAAGTGLSLSSGTFTNTQPGPTIGTTAPSSPTEGAMRYDTTNHVLKVYDGSAWVEVGSGGGGGSTTWGNIGGVLSNQTDLQAALDEKLESTDLVAGDGIDIAPIGSELPSGYTQLQSISSSGTQYILTGINYASGHTYEFTHRLFVDSSTESSRGTGWNAGAGIMMIDQSGIKYSGGGTSSVIGAAGAELELTISVGSGTSTYDYTIGGTTGSLSRSNTSLSSYAGNISYPLFVTTVNNGGGTMFNGSQMTATYYYFEAKDNNVLVRKMYPAKRDADNAIGMYDVVNDTFYTNNGSGTFIAGPAVPVGGLEISVDDSVWTDDKVEAGNGIIITPIGSELPTGYTQVAYMQLDGTQALRTNITGVGSTVELDLLCNSTAANVQEICAWDEDYLGTFFGIYGDAFAVQNSTAGKISGVNVLNRNTISGAFSRNTYPSVSLTVGGDTVSYTRTSNRNDNYLCIGGAISTLNQVLNGFSGYIFSVKIYNTTTSELIANYIPCTDNNTLIAGFYDTVSGTFYAATVGSFTAGPVTPAEGIEISVDPSTFPTYTAGDGIDITSGEISSTVLGFNNLTYDSMTMGTWSSTILSDLTFPSTAKMAFLNWRARDNTNTDLVYACGQVLIIRGLTLVSSFVGGGDGTNYIYGGVGLDSTNSYINYTQGGRTSNAVMDYTIYFYK